MAPAPRRKEEGQRCLQFAAVVSHLGGWHPLAILNHCQSPNICMCFAFLLLGHSGGNGDGNKGNQLGACLLQGSPYRASNAWYLSMPLGSKLLLCFSNTCLAGWRRGTFQ